jgi:hypothetical protein
LTFVRSDTRMIIDEVQREPEQCYHHYMDMTGTHQTLDGSVTEVTAGSSRPT